MGFCHSREHWDAELRPSLAQFGRLFISSLITQLRYALLIFYSNLRLLCVAVRFLPFNWAIIGLLDREMLAATRLESVYGNIFISFWFSLASERQNSLTIRKPTDSNQHCRSPANKLIINENQVLIGPNFQISFSPLLELHFNYKFHPSSMRSFITTVSI